MQKKSLCVLFLMVILISASLLAEEVIDPFADFPKTGTTAKAGEYVLTPGYKMLTKAVEEGIEKSTVIYYHAKMSEPGEKFSKVEFTFDGIKEIPNYLIIPIPAGQKAKKGDVLLTWWQSGSGLKRAYVVDDANPSEPVVKYIDIAYDNPAKNREGVPIGQMSEQLKPDTFVVIKEKFAPGTAVAVKDGPKRYRHAQVMKAEGEKVLVMGFAGRISVADRESCIPLDIIPSVKAGDTVQIPSVGSFKNASVIRVDEETGRVFAEQKIGSTVKETAVAFGDVAAGLEVF